MRILYRGWLTRRRADALQALIGMIGPANPGIVGACALAALLEAYHQSSEADERDGLGRATIAACVGYDPTRDGGFYAEVRR